MWRWFFAALLCFAGLSTAHAHMMLSQKGTLNIVGNGAFMVISIPASAFTGVDDDGDGKMSMAELQTHRPAIVWAAQSKIRLLDENGARPLEGVMLMHSPADETPNAPAPQIIVLGRFALAQHYESLRFELNLFGKQEAEQSYQITVTQGTDKQLMIIRSDRATRAIFPSAWAVLVDYVVLGAEHIGMGWDHLLFLWIVLAAARGWRQIVLALTAFAVGHAMTLTLSVLGGFSLPSAVVEPAIAATIIGMAALDVTVDQRGMLFSPWLRLGLVFACALIHGLGLAGVLTELGLDQRHQWLSLAGFNLGVEIGQLALAWVAFMVALGVQRLWGSQGIVLSRQFASFVAILFASVWLVQRLMALAS
jgi:HupE / UreJ protein